jgi:hypothetical protein
MRFEPHGSWHLAESPEIGVPLEISATNLEILLHLQKDSKKEKGKAFS